MTPKTPHCRIRSPIRWPPACSRRAATRPGCRRAGMCATTGIMSCPIFTRVISRRIAEDNGLARDGDTFFLRLVSWRASHDIAERGWTTELLRGVAGKLSALGRVLISSEAALPADLQEFRYAGSAAQVHHVMAFCRAFVGESATMASECAVLGVPAIYAAHTGRGYTNEQERRYGLVINVRSLDWPTVERAMDRLLSLPPDHGRKARAKLLAGTIDVAAFVVECLETFPEPLRRYRHSQAA